MTLIKELLTYKKDIDATQIAEILWLAKTINNSVDKKFDMPSPEEKDFSKPIKEKINTEDNQPHSPTHTEETLPREIEHPVVIRKAEENRPEYGVESNTNSSSYVTDIAQKHTYPNIIKQFQALRIKQKRLDNKLLDEDKSADYIATTGLFHPIFKEQKGRESYLTLHLIIDINESMFLWKDTIEHFQKSILNAKLFKNTVIFNLNSKEEKATLSYAKSKLKIEPTSNIFKKEKTLTLLFTDVIGKAWRTNDVFNRILNPWSKHSFVTIVSMLPKRMWQRTPLHQGVSLFMKSHKFLPKNSDLKSEYDFIEDTFGNESNKIPIIPYDKYGFEYLSHILTAKKGSWIDTRVFDGLEEVSLEEVSTTEINAKERVDNFFASVTPETAKLAIYCSALPLHKGIIEELIRVKKIGNKQDVFPEFYFGGLLDKRVQENQEIYSFYSGVRRELVSYITMDEVESVYHILDTVIKESLGSKRSMIELLYAQDNEEYKFSDVEKELVELLIEILGEKGRFFQKNIEYLIKLSNTIYPEKNYFIMGSNNYEYTKPCHKVTFNYDFSVAKYLVTFKEYDLFCKDTTRDKPRDMGWGRDNRPVINISWHDAIAYIEWLNNISGENYRLPKESEWEYICKAGILYTNWSFGNNKSELNKYVWYKGNSKKTTHPVGQLLPNDWGIYDMHGNVWEWCQDSWKQNYSLKSKQLPKYKVIRGGSIKTKGSNTQSIFRSSYHIDASSQAIGFRLLKDINYNTKKIENKKQLSKYIEPEMINIIHPKADVSLNISMIKVPKGNFIMGSINGLANETPEHKVEVDYEFEIGKFPVTVNEFRMFVEDTDYQTEAEKNNGAFVWIDGETVKKKDANWRNPYYEQSDDYPVVCISWNDAIEYINWLNSKSGLKFKLPTEAEWEYSCGSSSKGKWNDSVGDKEELKKYAWFHENSNNEIHPVGEKLPNSWGIYDMQGNVWEWCQDSWSKDYINSPNNSKNFYNTKSKLKVLRGGASLASSFYCRSSSRVKFEKYESMSTRGFRLAREVKSEAIHKVDYRDITFECKECNTKYSTNCKELHWEQVNGSERGMGTELEHQAEYFETCEKCNNDMSITFSCWEYPIGAENMRDVSSSGIINLKGDCCKEFNESDIDSFKDNSNIDWEREEDTYSSDITYVDLEDKIEILETFQNNLIPYANLEYVSEYDRDDYSDEDEYPEPRYLISEEFDSNYLDDLLDEIQDDINEAKHALDDDTGNVIYKNKLLHKKQYLIEYNDISESYGVDKDCNLYFHDNDQLLYIYPSHENDNTYLNASIGTEQFIESYGDDLHKLLKSDGIYEIYEQEVKHNSLPISSSKKFKIKSFDELTVDSITEAGAKYWKGYEDEDNRSYWATVVVELQVVFELEMSISDFNNDEEYELHYKPLRILENNMIALQGEGIVSVQLDVSGSIESDALGAFEEQDIHDISIIEEFQLHNDPLEVRQGQILGSSYFINIQLSNEDQEKLSNEIVYIDIRKYGIDKYLINPNEDEATEHDKERFTNILNNVKNKSWEFELRLNDSEPDTSLGYRHISSKVFTPIKNYYEIQEIKNWFLDNYKEPNTFPITLGEKDLQTFDDLKNTIFSQFETQYDTDIINHTIDEIKEEYGDIAWEKKSFLRVETKDGNIKHIDGDSYTEYVDSILNTKIYVPADKVYEFEVNDKYYDVNIHKISEQTISESQVTREMVNQTGATHQGTIKFKDNKKGNIEELNKLIDEQLNKEYGLAFYSIIDDEQDKEDYIDFSEAESEMEGWFYENYDDPVNFLPHDSGEGGYQYLYGGPYEIDEILYEEFGEKYPDEYIRLVIKELESQHGDTGWAKRPDENEGYVDEGYVEKGYFESDDPHDPDIREKEIKKIEDDARESIIEEREKELAQKIKEISKTLKHTSNGDMESQIDGDFNGWEGETIVKLMNGELWQQAEYYDHYMYVYMPKVTIINSLTGFKMKVDGIDKEVSVKQLHNAVQSNIIGSFNGWDGNTSVELTNGEKWKQSSYSYSYSYAYHPAVIIYESDYGYKMKVEGNNETVDVERVL